MADINIDYDKIDKVILELEKTLNQNLEDINSIYNTISHNLSESAGEEADALRKLSKAENRLMKVMKETLSRLGKNIHTAADELKKIDMKYATGVKITKE
jgi:uncharacterized protein YukE